MQVGAGLQASVADADAGVGRRGLGVLADGGRGGGHGSAGGALEGHSGAQGRHGHVAQGRSADQILFFIGLKFLPHHRL